jgi:hypothetical protein
VRTLPANSSIIDRSAFEKSSPREPAEVLRALPGVDTAYYGQGGIPSGPSVRGYTDRNFGQDLAGFIDGIPLNLFGFVASHGAMDITPVFTGSVERVELVRGPLEARYGDDQDLHLPRDSHPLKHGADLARSNPDLLRASRYTMSVADHPGIEALVFPPVFA